jgi:hypothetical protein
MIKKLGEKIKVVVNVVEDDEMDCYWFSSLIVDAKFMIIYRPCPRWLACAEIQGASPLDLSDTGEDKESMRRFRCFD